MKIELLNNTKKIVASKNGSREPMWYRTIQKHLNLKAKGITQIQRGPLSSALQT